MSKNGDQLFKSAGKTSGYVGGMNDLLDIVKNDGTDDADKGRLAFDMSKALKTKFKTITASKDEKMSDVLVRMVSEYVKANDPTNLG